MTIKIVGDSTTSMPKEFMDKEGIGYLESKIIINGEEFKDLTDLNREKKKKKVSNLDPY
ncbi:MAG: DegV family protein, partial [Candidatus Heimdallarchaeaceae archaeon]